MTPRAELAILAVVVLCAGCASQPDSDAMRREVTFGEPAEVTDARGTFRASVSLPFEQDTDENGTHTVQIPIEDSVPIVCHVWPGGSEIGVTAQRTSASILESLAEQGNEVSGYRLAGLEAGAVEGAPYQALAATFGIRSELGAGTGLMKVAVANKQGYGVGCNHWDAGYVASFGRVFREFVTSLQVAEPPPEPFYEEVSRVRIGDTPVGVTRVSFSQDAAGDVRALTQSSLLLPRSPSESVVSFSENIEWSRSNGDLINAYLQTSDADGRNTDLALRWDVDEGWIAAGLFKGKEIDAALGHQGNLAGSLREWLVLTRWLVPHGERQRATLPRWIASADPTRAMEETIEVEADDPRQATLRMGDMRMEIRRDEAGLPETGSIHVGPVEMRFERIHQYRAP